MELGEWLRVDGQADRPLFDQLRSQIIEAVRAGTLPPGSRLPTVRELAGELGLAVNTVARAYRELETAGIVETRGRFGTFVARADGDLAARVPAPTVRELAGELGLAVNTVARAYRELETAGIVETRGRFGTFVARADPSDSAMAAAARAYLDVARGLGLGKAEALRYLEAYEDG